MQLKQQIQRAKSKKYFPVYKPTSDQYIGQPEFQ